jgi:hypothetical protein
LHFSEIRQPFLVLYSPTALLPAKFAKYNGLIYNHAKSNNLAHVILYGSVPLTKIA